MGLWFPAVSSAAKDLMKKRREDLGLSQLQLANAVGVTPGAISQIETGKITPKRETAQRIDDELRASGAVLEAFGFVTPAAAPEWVPLEQHKDLAAKVEDLIQQVQDLTAQVDRLTRARRRGAN